MNELPKLWCCVQDGNARYFYIGPANCDGCDERLKWNALHVTNWSRNHFSIGVFCRICVRKGPMPKGPLPVQMNSQEQKEVCIVDGGVASLPSGSFPVKIEHHGFGTYHGNLSVFDAADPAKSGALEVIDHTRIAGREAQVLISRAETQALIEEKDRELSENEGLALLDDLAKPEPAERGGV